MKQIDFSTGDKIVTIKDGELRKGIIRTFFPVNPPVFVIEFEDGTVEKVPYNNVAQDPKIETHEEKNEPVEKSEITITPDEFRDIASQVIAKETKGNEIIGLMFVPLLAKIHDALFMESSENDNFFN